MADNWHGIPGRSGSPTPKFKIVIKKLDKKGGYLPGKKYKCKFISQFVVLYFNRVYTSRL